MRKRGPEAAKRLRQNELAKGNERREAKEAEGAKET
jgi:hypothetical protein